MRMRKVKLALQNLSAHRPVLRQLVEPSEHANLYPPPLRLIHEIGGLGSHYGFKPADKPCVGDCV